MVTNTIFVQILLTIVYCSRRLLPIVDGSPFIYTARIRQVPCSFKKTNEIGVCMFAAECIQQNGKHLSPCIDGIFFGSCCKLPVLEANATRPINVFTRKPAVTTPLPTKTTTTTTTTKTTTTTSTTTKRPVPSDEDTTIIWVNTEELSIGATKPNATNLVYVIDETSSPGSATASTEANENVTNQSTSSEAGAAAVAVTDNEQSSLPNRTTAGNEQPATLTNIVTSLSPTATTTTASSVDETSEPVSSSRPLVHETTSTESSMPTASVDDTVPIITNDTATSTLPTLLSLTTNSLHETINMSDYRDVCGRRFIRKKRIVGGKTSQYGDWPWQLSLMVYNRNENTFLHKCGAILVKETWAVTAAHCVQFDEPQNVLLRMGDYDLSNEDEPHSPKFVEVQIIALHQQFDRQTYEYDIALLRFKEPIQFQPNIVPICIPDSDDDFVGQTAFATGWGRLREGGPLPSIINQIELPVISNDECMSMYRRAGFSEYIPEIFICAGRKEGETDSCEGDSGGPLALRRADDRFLLAGIISWGIDCGQPNQPGVYVRVSYFREWINQIIQF